MRCIIYLGHHKTGSSALQELFTRNATKMQARGILYPFVEPKGAAYAKKLLPDRTYDGDLSFHVKSPHNHIAYQMMAETVQGYQVPKRYAPLPAVDQMFADLAHQIDTTQPHTLLLCSEVFSQFGVRHPSLARQLIDKLGISDTSLYMTLRRPDLHVAAWYSQMLKFGGTPPRLSQGGMARFYGTTHFEFQQAVAPWAAAVPREKLHLHTYNAIMAQGGSIPHFARTVGLDMTGLGDTGLSANPSIPYALFDFVAQANHDLSPQAAARLRRLLGAQKAQLSVTPNAEIELFGQNVRDEMSKKFAQSEAYLAKIAGKKAFFEDISAIQQISPITQATASAAATAVARKVLPAHVTRGPLYDWLMA